MNSDAGKTDRSAHGITLHARNTLDVRGVTDVVSFDEQAVILDTVCGNLTVEGSSLHIHVLNMEQGVVVMDGKVDAIVYSEPDLRTKDEKNGFFKKLFR